MANTEEKTHLDTIQIAEIMEILPHRYPMLLVDRIINITKDNGGTGVKNVTINEPFFVGHFPAMPVFPGVMIIEAMAQTAAAYTAYVEDLDTKNRVVLFLGAEKARFRKPVVPGDQMLIHVKVAQRRPPVWRFEARAEVDGNTVAEASFSAMLTAPM